MRHARQRRAAQADRGDRHGRARARPARRRSTELLAALGNAFPGRARRPRDARPRDGRGARLRRVAASRPSVSSRRHLTVVRRRSAGTRRASRLVRSRRTATDGRRVAARDRRRPARRRRGAARVGDSVSIDGVCLTAVAVADGAHRVRRRARDARAHLARRPRAGRRASTSSRRCAPASRSAATTSRATSTASARARASSRRATAAASGSTRRAELLRYVVEKGSIAVEGTSLTVAALDDARLRGRARSRTRSSATTLGELAPGDPVNLEADVLAKYVERLLAGAA